MVPIKGTLYLIAAGLVFSTFNAIWEEFILKGILWNGVEGIFGTALPIIIFQALLFGLMHLNGFPRGWVGAGMAAVYGFFIGVIRKRSGGCSRR
jgi:membrane protease YdiL (CAAX protease family)